MNKTLRTLFFRLGDILVLFTLVLGSALNISAAPMAGGPAPALASGTPSTPVSTGGITPYIFAGRNPGGNVECSELGYAFGSGRREYKSGKNSFDGAFPAGIQVTVNSGTSVTWTSTFPIGAVIVKGGNAANVYEYIPQSAGDSGLAAPQAGKSGKPAGLGNLTFCWNSIPATGNLEVSTELVPDTDPGKFDLQIDGITEASNVGNGGSTGPKTLGAGTHTVGEVAGSGTDLADYTASIECRNQENTLVASSSDAGPLQVNVGAGDDIRCVITNTRKQPEPGKILVRKETLPDGDPQVFDFTASYDSNGFSLADGQMNDSGPLPPGPYSVSENVPEGWILQSAICDDDDSEDPASLILDPGETITCTFTNEKLHPQSITIGTSTSVTSTDEFPVDPDQVFNFSGDFGSFSLKPGEAKQFTNLPVGTYVITTEMLPGWHLNLLACNGNTDLDISASFSTGTFTIGLDPDENISCYFGYVRAIGRLKIVKQVEGNAAPANWAFNLQPKSGTPLAEPFVTLPGQGGSTDFIRLLTGTYDLREVLQPGYEVTSISCGTDGSNVNLATGSIEVTIMRNEDVTCTFTNKEISR